jgi:hypothetical protein
MNILTGILESSSNKPTAVLNPNNGYELLLPPPSDPLSLPAVNIPNIGVTPVLTESPEALQSENTVDKNAQANPTGVSNGKPVVEVANWISAIKRKLETNVVNSRQNRTGVTSLNIENWEDIVSYFTSLNSMAPDAMIDSCPPTPVFRINNVPAEIQSKTAFSDYLDILGTESAAMGVIRRTGAAIVGTQLRMYVGKRKEVSISLGSRGIRGPRNMLREMSTKLHCAEIKVKKWMLWSSLVEKIPTLVVTGETLFGWILTADTAVSSKTIQNFVVETVYKETPSSMVTTNIQLDVLLRSSNATTQPEEA